MIKELEKLNPTPSNPDFKKPDVIDGEVISAKTETAGDDDDDW